MLLFKDWNNNSRNIKGRMIMIGFRLSHIASKNRILFLLLIPQLVIYRVVVEWFLGVELPYKTVIKGPLTLFHGQALVVNDGTTIGRNCILRHSTTIGTKLLPDGSYSRCPVLGDNVDVGANVCIIGDIKIGNNVKIGAGSVVVKDVPENSIIVGNPARIIRTFQP
jgi:putative colanic acid biosynthesis acetyltransferase WcaB